MGKTREPATPAVSTETRRASIAPMAAEERARMIAEEAYLLAEQRGFVPGGEVEDWLAAERAVDARLAARN